jgi:hypothetical protein
MEGLLEPGDQTLVAVRAGMLRLLGLLDSDYEIDWRYEVSNGDTVLGLREWIAHRHQPDDGVQPQKETP